MLRENLIKYREKKNLNKKQLAEKAKVHFQTVRHLENGEATNPAIATVEKIAVALDVTVNDLIK